MMEESDSTANVSAVSIADELKEAACTNVTQAQSSDISREMTPPRSTISLTDSPSSVPLSDPSPIVMSSPLSNVTPLPVVATRDTTHLGDTKDLTSGFVNISTTDTPSVGTFPSAMGTTTTAYTPIQSIDPKAFSGTIQSPQLQTQSSPAAYSSPFVPNVLPPGSQDEITRTSLGVELVPDDASLGPVYPTPEQSGAGGIFGWFSGSQIVNKVMEKTKNSVESVITTLDPGMKEVINSGGDIQLIVTSGKEVKISGVRQAFQEVFGRATVHGQESEPNIAPQPVGFTSAMKGAEERIENLRRNEKISETQAAISVENFIAEVLPDRWYDVACLLLRDPEHNIELQTFSQATPISTEYVLQAQAQTPDDYDKRWSGLSVTIGQIIQSHLPHVDPVNWHEHCTGISRQTMIYNAAKMIANMYKQRLPENKIST